MQIRFLLHWACQFRSHLILIGGLALLGSVAALALPWLAARLAAGIVSDTTIDLERTFILLAISLISMTMTTILVSILSEAASGQILARLRREAYEHVLAMPVSFHYRNRDGDLLALMSYEVQNLSAFLTNTLAQMPAMLMTAVGAVVLLFVIDPAMAFIVPVMVPIFYIGMKLLGRRLRIFGIKVRKAEVDVLWMAESDLEMVSGIKAFAVEDEHRARYLAAIEKARKLRLDQARLTAFIGPTVALVAALAAIAILVIGSAGIAEGTRSPSELFAFLLYAALLTRPVGSLASTYGSYQLARGTLARLQNVFALPPEPGYAMAQELPQPPARIDFDLVSFAYPGRPPLLQDFNLSINRGEIIALTGANGVGKSTLINLLLRFYEPDGGRITLDGADITALNVKHLRRQFGYVPQRPLLLNASIIDNISFGHPDPDLGAIEKAARLAQAWDFINQLPAGLETQIGDDGVRLSGGQRQRIALARALFRAPPIYIFDEATSMYDLEGEAAFVESCIQSLAGRTVIIITHRPASLALAHRIIELTPSGVTIVANRESRQG
jgi:ATP-binding cassette subfamily B protein/subfamily B ATP-binding cassette protein MsbA